MQYAFGNNEIKVGNYIQFSHGGALAWGIIETVNPEPFFITANCQGFRVVVLLRHAYQVITPEEYHDRRVGLGPIHTGDWDPFTEAALSHDDEMQKQINKRPHERPIVYTGKFIKNVAVTAAKGVYAVVFALPYAIIGGIVGLVRGNSRLTREEIDNE